MTAIGQTTHNGTYHLHIDGVAACGAGRIAGETIPATDSRAYGRYCPDCREHLRRAVTLQEVTTAAPLGYRIRGIRDEISVVGPFGTGFSTYARSPWEALRAARQDVGARVRARRAAATAERAEREERDRRANAQLELAQERVRAAGEVVHTHCRECGKTLSAFDLAASNVPGYCFNCE